MMKPAILSCLMVLMVPLAGIAHAEEVGIIGAANPAATGTYPDQPERVLEIGQTLVFQEKITTDENGSAQLAFTDGSAMAVGSNAALVIDEYVYDPDTSTGKMSARLIKGALRFVGGAVSHQSGVNIETPTAVIGVRGGIVTLDQQNEVLHVINHFGVVTVQTQQETRQITRQDVEISIGTDGAIRLLGAVDRTRLTGLGQMLSSMGPQTGGALQLPSDELLGRVGSQAPAAPAQVPIFEAAEKAQEGPAALGVPESGNLLEEACDPAYCD